MRLELTATKSYLQAVDDSSENLIKLNLNPYPEGASKFQVQVVSRGYVESPSLSWGEIKVPDNAVGSIIWHSRSSIEN